MAFYIKQLDMRTVSCFSSNYKQQKNQSDLYSKIQTFSFNQSMKWICGHRTLCCSVLQLKNISRGVELYFNLFL